MRDYQKPSRKPGLVCWYARWDRDGKLREALYRKPERGAQPAPKPAPAAPRPTPAAKSKTSRTERGVLAAERRAAQGSFDL